MTMIQFGSLWMTVFLAPATYDALSALVQNTCNVSDHCVMHLLLVLASLILPYYITTKTLCLIERLPLSLVSIFIGIVLQVIFSLY